MAGAREVARHAKRMAGRILDVAEELRAMKCVKMKLARRKRINIITISINIILVFMYHNYRCCVGG